MKEALSETSDRWRSKSRLCSFSIGSLSHRGAFNKADIYNLFWVEIQQGGKAIARSGSISQRHGSADPDPRQNVMDPEHCC
jgi:hypothetical protein